MNTAHKLADGIRSVIGYWTPTPTKSQFVEKGTLTPQEFLEAGDQLVFKFPTWEWQRAVSKRSVPWLPEDKQYLIIRGVACRSRVRELDSKLLAQSRTDGDGWFLPLGDEAGPQIPNVLETSSNPPADAPPTGEETGGGASSQHPTDQPNYLIIQSSNPNRKVNHLPDISMFKEIDLALDDEDDDGIMVGQSNGRGGYGTEGGFMSQPADDNQNKDFYYLEHHDAGPGDYYIDNDNSGIITTRSYDLSFTYDKYYQTPRLWLFGYDENGVPLSSDQIFEDILTEYVSRTVTVDPHPCTGIPTISIHPCRHAAVMKKVVAGWVSQNMSPRHDLSLFVLLKFISSVIPTISYDFTIDIQGFYLNS